MYRGKYHLASSIFKTNKLVKIALKILFSFCFRVHFVISLEGRNLVLKSKSLNGTFVNGSAVEEKCLVSGDIVAVLDDDFELFKIEME